MAGADSEASLGSMAGADSEASLGRMAVACSKTEKKKIAITFLKLNTKILTKILGFWNPLIQKGGNVWHYSHAQFIPGMQGWFSADDAVRNSPAASRPNRPLLSWNFLSWKYTEHLTSGISHQSHIAHCRVACASATMDPLGATFTALPWIAEVHTFPTSLAQNSQGRILCLLSAYCLRVIRKIKKKSLVKACLVQRI